LLGAWCLVLGAWCLVLGAWCLVLGAWCMIYYFSYANIIKIESFINFLCKNPYLMEDSLSFLSIENRSN